LDEEVEVMPPGRPTEYREEFNEQAEKLCTIFGACDKKLGKFFKVSKTTITNWKSTYPEFLASIKKGKDIFDAENVEASLLERACGYQHEEIKYFAHEGVVTDERVVIKQYPPETTAAIFWLKNRHPDRWKDVKRSEVTGKDGGPIETATRNIEITADMDPKEASRRYAEYIRGTG
jgi:hypothetical protein